MVEGAALATELPGFVAVGLAGRDDSAAMRFSTRACFERRGCFTRSSTSAESRAALSSLLATYSAPQKYEGPCAQGFEARTRGSAPGSFRSIPYAGSRCRRLSGSGHLKLRRPSAPRPDTGDCGARSKRCEGHVKMGARGGGAVAVRSGRVRTATLNADMPPPAAPVRCSWPSHPPLPVPPHIAVRGDTVRN